MRDYEGYLRDIISNYEVRNYAKLRTFVITWTPYLAPLQLQDILATLQFLNFLAPSQLKDTRILALSQLKRLLDILAPRQLQRLQDI